MKITTKNTPLDYYPGAVYNVAIYVKKCSVKTLYILSNGAGEE